MDEDKGGESRVAVVGDIGRHTIRLALTDEAGALRPDTLSTYEASASTTLSGAISDFARRRQLARLPRRCAISVSGAPRGDVIAITHSRWLVSRSGLAAMFQANPLIVNDSAAHAWALSGADGSARIDPIGGPAPAPEKPGVYTIIGVGSGLGVAVLARDEEGGVAVLATEAGHCGFMQGLPEVGAFLDATAAATGPVAEAVVSRSGLVSAYRWLARRAGLREEIADAEAIVRLATMAHAPVADEAVRLFCRALWHFAGNMALAHGAWDGVFLTGTLAAATAATLRRPDMIDHFLVPGPYQKKLRDVPRAMVGFDHPELRGAAQALLARDRREGWSRQAPLAAAPSPSFAGGSI